MLKELAALPHLRELLKDILVSSPQYQVQDHSFYFKTYESADQEPLVQDLIDNILMSQHGDVICGTSDSKLVRGAVFTGMSGSGKTRLAVELMDIMRQLLDKVPDPNKMQRALKGHLANPRIVHINFSGSDTRFHEVEEADWSAELIIGARLAAKVWWPGVHFGQIRKAINSIKLRERYRLSYTHVLDAILGENNAQNDQNKKFTALHIILDEFQVMASVNLTYKNNEVQTEPMSRAIYRELTESNRQQFVFTSFVGTSLQDLFVDMSSSIYPCYCIQRLSIQSCERLIAQELGEKWLKCPDLDKLLIVIGGNPRLLEILVKSLLAPIQEEPDLFNVARKLSDLNGAAETIFNRLFLAQDTFVWPILLSLAGCGFNEYSTVAVDKSGKAMTAHELAQQSYISIRSPNSSEHADRTLVLDTPTILAQWALGIKGPDTSAFVSNNRVQPQQMSALRKEAISMTEKADLDTTSFEKLVARQFVFRWNMCNFSNDVVVCASQLFNGGYFSEKFRSRDFALEDELAEASFGDNNEVFIAHFRLTEYDLYKTGRKVIVWIDAKHMAVKGREEYLTDNQVKLLRDKLESLQKAPELSEYIHLLVVISNRKYIAPNDIDTELGDNMCVIARDGLMFGTAPWISLIAQTLRSKE